MCLLSFLIYMSHIWIYIISCVHPAGRLNGQPLSGHPSVFLGKHFSVGHHVQTFQPVSFIPALLMGTIYLYRVILLSVTLTVAGGQKVRRSAQSKTGWLHFLTHFLTELDEIWHGDETIQIKYPKTTVNWDFVNQEKEVLFYWLHQKKNFNVGILWDIYELSHILTVSKWFWPRIKIMRIWESKNFFAGLMNLILIFILSQWIFKGENSRWLAFRHWTDWFLWNLV